MPVFDEEADLECACPVAAGATLAVRDEDWTLVVARGVTLGVDKGFSESSGGNVDC
jgi:hypothetical protein